MKKIIAIYIKNIHNTFVWNNIAWLEMYKIYNKEFTI